MENGTLNGTEGLDVVILWVQVDIMTKSIAHVALGYTFKGEYCGDFELNATTLAI